MILCVKLICKVIPSVCAPQAAERQAARDQKKTEQKANKQRRRAQGKRRTQERRRRQERHRKAKTQLSAKLMGKTHNMSPRTEERAQLFVGLKKDEVVELFNQELKQRSKTTCYEIKKSEHEHGWSLFLSADLKKGEMIANYEGEFRRGLPGGHEDRAVELRALREQMGTYETFLHGSLASLGTWLNDAHGTDSHNNTKLVEDDSIQPGEPGACWVEAAEDISASKEKPVELLLYYGDEYWRVRDELDGVLDNSESEYSPTDTGSCTESYESESDAPTHKKRKKVSSMLCLDVNIQHIHANFHPSRPRRRRRSRRSRRSRRRRKRRRRTRDPPRNLS